MAEYALVVMSEPGEPTPGGQGRMVHAMTAARDLNAAGHDATLWFHGIGVTWLGTMDGKSDAFARHYWALFDEVRGFIGGACEFCTAKRFGVAPAAERLGVPLVGGDEHHSVAALIAEGRQVITF